MKCFLKTEFRLPKLMKMKRKRIYNNFFFQKIRGRKMIKYFLYVYAWCK